MEDNITLDDVAEVLAFVMSQEKVMSVPPVLIPTEGLTKPPLRQEPRNTYYTQKDPRSSQSFSDSHNETLQLQPEEFPIKGRSDDIGIQREI